MSQQGAQLKLKGKIDKIDTQKALERNTSMGVLEAITHQSRSNDSVTGVVPKRKHPQVT